MHLNLGPGFFHFVINALNIYLFCFQHWQELSIVHKNTKNLLIALTKTQVI